MSDPTLVQYLLQHMSDPTLVQYLLQHMSDPTLVQYMLQHMSDPTLVLPPHPKSDPQFRDHTLTSVMSGQVRELTGKMLIPSSRIRLLDTLGHGKFTWHFSTLHGCIQTTFKMIIVLDPF